MFPKPLYQCLVCTFAWAVNIIYLFIFVSESYSAAKVNPQAWPVDAVQMCVVSTIRARHAGLSLSFRGGGRSILTPVTCVQRLVGPKIHRFPH